MPTWPPQCAGCGKFMSYKDMGQGIVYTPYGGYMDLEPPPSEHIHGDCWDEMSEDRRDLIRRISWSGPHDLRYTEKDKTHGTDRESRASSPESP